MVFACHRLRRIPTVSTWTRSGAAASLAARNSCRARHARRALRQSPSSPGTGASACLRHRPGAAGSRVGREHGRPTRQTSTGHPTLLCASPSRPRRHDAESSVVRGARFAAPTPNPRRLDQELAAEGLTRRQCHRDQHQAAAQPGSSREDLRVHELGALGPETRASDAIEDALLPWAAPPGRRQEASAAGAGVAGAS